MASKNRSQVIWKTSEEKEAFEKHCGKQFDSVSGRFRKLAALDIMGKLETVDYIEPPKKDFPI